MKPIRVAAAMLAILTALVAGFFSVNPSVGGTVPAVLGVAAVCLAIVTPFDALEPPARKRVFAACVGFVVAVAIALWLALGGTPDLVELAAVALLLAAGLVLAGWSFKTRNRKRRRAWADYYDTY